MTRITAIETFVASRVCVVAVRCDDGTVGFGQTAPSEPEITAEVLHRLVARHFLGGNPWDLATLNDRCVRDGYKYLGTFLFRALSGVDTAIWDLIGKLTGQPVYQLLGGRTRRRLAVYASSMSRDTSPKEEVARLKAALDGYGFRCAKIKIGVRNGRDRERLDGRTRALVPAVRQALGEDTTLFADANGAYSPGQAVRVGRYLEEHGFSHLEEPTPCWELDNMGEVARALDLTIGAGEQEFSLELIRKMVAERLVDVIQPDVCYVGGMTRARQVAQLADIAGIPCMPHGSNRSLLQVFTAHLVSAMPACTEFTEWSIEDQGPVGEIYGPIPVIEDGEIELSDAPGWGIEILPSFLERAVRRSSMS